MSDQMKWENTEPGLREGRGGSFCAIAEPYETGRTRYLPPTIRDNVLRVFGRRIMHANYRPLLDDP